MNDLRNWEKIKDEILGEAYDLSLAFVTAKKGEEAHNVLSYPLSQQSGEILINKREAKKTGHSVLELFIHGLLHLKGLDHGSTMEHEERRLLRHFATNGPSNRRRS